MNSAHLHCDLNLRNYVPSSTFAQNSGWGEHACQRALRRFTQWCWINWEVGTLLLSYRSSRYLNEQTECKWYRVCSLSKRAPNGQICAKCISMHSYVGLFFMLPWQSTCFWYVTGISIERHTQSKRKSEENEKVKAKKGRRLIWRSIYMAVVIMEV